ncbi:hypothetical protein CIL05_11360 [Virgibacillus profundi]|uniref:Isoprenylcysteine carboxyl methyltransferase n=1 Tax=Virgibacillus profundi TaxID=2024555 RepID=A0A2A2IDK8_9BACI|nr:isoprenylcysteine carboxylmethyltransferase family protein [Virgibacillus profundi]PAV29458.1 hypothetical protein CIL05_11360 [Virgibacillus profundi]PXY53626.1 hypothetical protein CIT14_11470 [Virgibacillus profundi]
MQFFMWILLCIIIAQRLIELVIANKNEIWMKEQGGVETGERHYKWFIILHSSFFVAMIVEALVRDVTDLELNYFLLFVFIITQIGRIWCIATLGKFWNTKIIVLQDFPLVKKGPYTYIKHPNYIIVGIELFTIPLIFGAIITAIVFPILHILLLMIRIPMEEKALAKANF